METLKSIFYLFQGSLIGHITLVVYLFVVTNKPLNCENLKKLPSMLLSPLIFSLVAVGLSADPARILDYSFLSALILTTCTLWAMWAWGLSFWWAFSMVCMSGTFQVAVSTMTRICSFLLPYETVPQYLLFLTLYFSFVCATALLLKKTHFSTYFRLLMEDESSLRQTALLILTLEIITEAFLILQSGILPSYLAVYYLLAIALVALMAGLLVYLAQQLDTRRRLQAQQDIIAQQQLYEQNLEEIRREVRTFRHDYKNLLASLSEQAETGEWDELRRSLTKLDAGFDRRLGEKIQTSVQIGNLQIPPIRSLLLSNLTLMRNRGVECRLEALYPVTQAGMDPWDLVRCLGILVDNAIEASLETTQP